MPSKVTALPVKRSFGETMRKDAWWIEPIVVFTVFTGFIVYATWAVYQGANYYHENMLSPFYSPLVWGEGEHAIMQRSGPPAWWPGFLPFSPAILVMWAPVTFRLTCYYYRGAYYKAFWADPPSCSVGEPRNKYLGERHFPLIIQNIHRYTIPFALALLVFLTLDAWHTLWYTTADGGKEFGFSVGTIVLTMNLILLAGYTFGCHSIRHLVGGGIDILSRKPMRKVAYACVTCFNKSHMRWAWASLIWVALTDIYVRLCATGVITNVRFF